MSLLIAVELWGTVTTVAEVLARSPWAKESVPSAGLNHDACPAGAVHFTENAAAAGAAVVLPSVGVAVNVTVVALPR